MTARVAYVNHRFPVLTQTFTVGEIEDLEDLGVPVTIFSLRRPLDEPHGPVATKLAARTRYLPGPVSGASLWALVRWAVRRPWPFLGLLGSTLTGTYRDEKVRCLLRSLAQFAQGAALADIVARAPGIRHLHAQFLDSGSTAAWVASRLAGRTFSFANHTAYNPYLTRAKLRGARFATSISDFDRDRVIRDGGPRYADRVRVVRCGVDVDAWSGLERDPEPGLVLSVGALREKKGHHVLIEACARLRDEGRPFRCEIVGEGAERPRLEADVRRFDLAEHVTLVGALSPEETRERYRRAEIFALPCVVAGNGDLDGVPIVLMEALAAGVPCVSTRLSGIPEIIEDGIDGLLAEPGDAAGLAGRLHRLLLDAPLRERLARAGRRRARETCDRRTNVAGLAALLSEAVA